MAEKHQFTRSAIVKDRTRKKVVARFENPDHAKDYTTMLNKRASKNRFHWYESNEEV